MRAPDAAAARALDAELSLASVDPSRAVGLVLTGDLLRGHSSDPRLVEVLGGLIAAARRAGDALEPELTPSLPEARADLAPWISLSSGERLVVPKLGALSPALRFEREVQGAAARCGARVVPPVA